MTAISIELLMMRNAHTPYKLQDSQNGSELGPISAQGRAEAAEGATYLSRILAGRTLKFYASPLTRRAKDTALQTAANIQQNGARMPGVFELFLVPEDMQPVGYIKPNLVAQREYEASLTLEHHLASVEEVIEGKVLPVIVMSGRAIWLSFGQKLSTWPGFGETAIPTASVIHRTRAPYNQGFLPHGHNADELAKYLEEQRLKNRNG